MFPFLFLMFLKHKGLILTFFSFSTLLSYSARITQNVASYKFSMKGHNVNTPMQYRHTKTKYKHTKSNSFFFKYIFKGDKHILIVWLSLPCSIESAQ